MDAQTAKEVRDKAIAVLTREFPDLSFTTGGGKYSNNYTIFKLTISEKTSTGEAITRESENFNIMASVLDLSPNLLFQDLMFKGEKYKLIGYNSSRRKYPFVVRRAKDSRTVLLTKITKDMFIKS